MEARETAWVVLIWHEDVMDVPAGVTGVWIQQEKILTAADRRAANAEVAKVAKDRAFVVTPARSWVPVRETVAKKRLDDFDPFGKEG